MKQMARTVVPRWSSATTARSSIKPYQEAEKQRIKDLLANERELGAREERAAAATRDIAEIVRLSREFVQYKETVDNTIRDQVEAGIRRREAQGRRPPGHRSGDHRAVAAESRRAQQGARGPHVE
jgi:hypothetical protein